MLGHVNVHVHLEAVDLGRFSIDRMELFVYTFTDYEHRFARLCPVSPRPHVHPLSRMQHLAVRIHVWRHREMPYTIVVGCRTLLSMLSPSTAMK